MKTFIVIFCIVGMAIGWLATHMTPATGIIRETGRNDGFRPLGEVQPHTVRPQVPVSSKSTNTAPND